MPTTGSPGDRKYLVWFLIVVDGIPQTMKDGRGKKVPCTVAARNDAEYREHYNKGWVPTEPGVTHLDGMDEIKALEKEYLETRPE